MVSLHTLSMRSPRLTASPDDSVSEAPTEVPEAAPQPAGRLPPMVRLADIMRNIHNPRPDAGEASSSTMPSERMVRLQETIGRMRDQSIRLKEASEALKERSSALRQQSMDDRPISPVSDDDSAASTESTVNPNSFANLTTARMTEDMYSQYGENSLSDIGERDQYWQNRFTSSSPTVTAIEVSTTANYTEVPAIPVSTTASEHAFDEASQRTVNLGLELLRRTSSFSVATPEEQEDSDGHQDDSSSDEGSTTWPPRHIPTVSDAAEDRERSRLSMLSRLIARRPLPPCPIPVSQAPATRGRSRSPSPRPDRSLSPRSGFVYNGSPSRPWRHTMPATVRIASPRPISPSTVCSYSPRSPVYVPHTRGLYSPSSMGSVSPLHFAEPIVPPTICRLPSTRSSSPSAEHSCGWSAECDKLKRQIDDVQMALGDLRTDFECAVNDRRLKPEAEEAPGAAQTAAATGAQSTGHASQPFVPPSFPPGFVPSLPVVSPPLFCSNLSHTFGPSQMASGLSQPRPMVVEELRPFRESELNAELFRIESRLLPELKQELGLAHKDLPSLTVREKVYHRLLNV